MPKYVTEFIGTFFLVFTIGLAGSGPNDKMAALAIGSVLMVMVYMGGHISGAQYNPAVALAVLLRGKLDIKDLGPYLVAQLAGGLAGAGVAYLCTDKTIPIGPDPKLTGLGAILTEILYTFALVLVILNVATSKKTEGNSYYGLAIGFTITAAAFAGGPVSGGAYNPAVGIGLTTINVLFGGGGFQHLWLYIVGPILGGCAAAVVFKYQEGETAAS